MNNRVMADYECFKCENGNNPVDLCPECEISETFKMIRKKQLKILNMNQRLSSNFSLAQQFQPTKHCLRVISHCEDLLRQVNELLKTL